jgi:hypothetical protein
MTQRPMYVMLNEVKHLIRSTAKQRSGAESQPK